MTGSGSRSVTIVIAAALAASAMVAVLAWRIRGAARPATHDVAPPAASPPISAEPRPAAPTRSVVDDAEADDPAEPARLRTRGIVLGADDAPRAGVALGFAHGASAVTAIATSGADGRFEIEAPGELALLVASDPRWSTLRAAEIRADHPDEEATIVIAPAIEIAGRVVGPEGSGIPHAAVAIEIADRGTWNPSPDRATRSEAEGRFRLPRAPLVPGAELVASCAGYRSVRRAVPESSASDVVLVLQTSGETPLVLEGVVVREDGAPVHGASVTLGPRAAATDGRGAFRMDVAWTTPETPLVARAVGFLPAVVAGYGANLGDDPRRLERVRLVLGPAAVAISGRVVDEGGQPLKRWRVGTAESSLLETGAFTDREGRFEIAGLDRRDYRLRAEGARPGQWLLSDPIQAPAQDVLLRAPAPGLRQAVRGHVRDAHGGAVAGAFVLVQPPGEEWIPPEAWRRAGSGRAGVRTDDAGAFEILDAPASAIQLLATGDAILPARTVLAPGGRVDEVEIRASRRVRFRFEAAASDDPPDELLAHDREGRAVPLWGEGAFPSQRSGRIALRDGRSGSIWGGEEIRGVHVLRRGRRIGGLVVELAPGADEVVLAWP